MVRTSLTCLLTLTLIATTGCQSGGLKDSWARLTTRKADKQELTPQFKEAQRMLKNPEQTLVAMARWKEDNEEYAEAREKYRELLLAYPDNLEAQLGLARIEMATGRQQQAEEQLSILAKKHPDNLQVASEQARLYSQREDWGRAISILNAASDRHPDDQSIRYELGVAYARSGQVEAAVPHLTFAVGESAAKYNIGYMLYESGNKAEAAEWLEKSLRSHPDERTSYQAKALLAQLIPSEQQQIVQSSHAPSAGPVIAPSIQPRPRQQRMSEPVRMGSQFEDDQYSSATKSEVGSPSALQAVSFTQPATPVGFASSPQVVGQTSDAAVSASNGKAVYSMDNGMTVPQWSGPAAKPQTPPQGASAPGPNAPIEPPAWRARR
ncbi:MAG: tetratricopeptide repeat protein [Planctomyces sp.]|nr:tetratricopeptide repeat protein [Planctomyces sp.]